MSETENPPRGRAVEPHERVPSALDSMFGSQKDRLEWFNRSVRPVLFASLGASMFLMALMVATAFGVAVWRSALALPVGDMTVGFGPLVATAIPLILAQIHRSQEKRAGVTG